MTLWDRLELKDYLLIPLSLTIILVALSNLAGGGSPIFEAIASSRLSFVILAISLAAGSALLALNSRRGWPGGKREPEIAVLEVREVPRNYLLDDRLSNGRWNRAFYDLVRALTIRGQPFCLHIHFEGGRGRIRVLIKERFRGGEEHLLHLLHSQLQGFAFSIANAQLPQSSEASVRQILGNPGSDCDDLTTTLSEFFLQSREAGDYVAFFRPFKPSRLERRALNRRYKEASSRAAKSRTRKSFWRGETTEQSIDYVETERLEQASREIERLSADYALKVNIYVAASSENEKLADRLAEEALALARAALSKDVKEVPKAKRIKFEKFKRSLEGLEPVGKPSVLHPAEARALFQFPRTSIGIVTTERARHPLPPLSEDGVLLGNLQAGATTTPEEARIPVEALAKQVLVAGSTGSGKTSFILDMLIDIYRKGIPFIVFAPVKREYRALIKVLPDALLFTVCNEQVSPLRFNPLLPPKGTLNQTHVDNFRNAFEASYPLYPPMPYVLSQCLANVYARKGWDLLGYGRGETLLLSHLRREIEEYTRSLGYETDLKKDIEAALKIRLERLTGGALGAMLNTSRPFPLDLFMSSPTIFEFDDLADDREKALIIALMLIAIREQVQALGPSEGTRLVIVIEEAHRLLMNIDTYTTLPDAADARRGAIQYISNMLAEMRAHGVAIVLVDQMPSKLFQDAIKNTSTKVVFRLVPDDDRRILGSTMNLDEEEVRSLLSQRVGEATVFTESASHAFQIKVQDLVEKYGIKPSTNVTDDEVREHMQDFYSQNPLTILTAECSSSDEYADEALSRDGTPLCEICSPDQNPRSCIIGRLAAEVLKVQEVRSKLAELLSQSAEAEELANYLLELSKVVLGEENAKLSFCILAQTKHENVLRIAAAVHRELKERTSEKKGTEN